MNDVLSLLDASEGRLPDPNVDPTLTPEQTADVLGVGVKVVYAAVRNGTLPSIRLGRRIRIPTAALLAMLGVEQ